MSCKLRPKLMILIIIAVGSTAINGHVALIFPRARKYDLDFLDSARTPGPCGMPRGDVKTQLLAGSKFNISWHSAYAHNGGFKLQILDAFDRPLVDLTPVTQHSEFVQGDATAQWYPVELPQNFTCANCTVRLLREADEWGSNFRFWSCADIDILDRKVYREDCSGHGRYLLGRCRCDRLYRGSRCEFKDDCLDDSDCGNQGVCVDNGGLMTPTKYCYCNAGWYGPRCQKKSIVKSSEIDLDGYTMKRFTNDFLFYWRIIKDTKELEGVMVVNTTSWAAVGWRPRNLTPNCRAFPDIHDKSAPDQLNHSRHEINSTRMAITTKQVNEQIGIGPQYHLKAEKLKHTTGESIAEQSKSSAQRRSAKQFHTGHFVTPRIENDYTVQTSITYKISTKHGRKRRFFESTTTQPIGISTSTVPEANFELITESGLTWKPKLEINFTDMITSVSDPHSTIQFESTRQPVFDNSSHSPEWELQSEHIIRPELDSEFTSVDLPHSQFTSKSNSESTSMSNFGMFLSESRVQSVTGTERNLVTKLTSGSKSGAELLIQSRPEIMPILSNFISNRSSTSVSSSTSQNVGTKNEVNAEATEGAPKPDVHKYTPKHDFNPMDCTDMIIGMAKNDAHRIGDYYTRDRSTPQPDIFWGGKDSLTAATGFEKDGVTTIMFRKLLEANEPTDYDIMDADMQVIWAKGQEPGAYNHQSPTILEKKKTNIEEFYESDELKYHGNRLQRGVTTFNFFDEKNREKSTGQASSKVMDKYCVGEWKYPRSCTVEDASCEYHIRWVYNTKNDLVTFTIMSKNSDVWTGVGFSNNEKMTQTDAVLGWVDKTNGRPFVMDTWISGYNAPLLDPSQDIYNTSGKIENGSTFLTFSRKRGPRDMKDLSFTDDHCLYMIFPVRGGIFNSVNKKIRKHSGNPIVSSDKICIKSCGIEYDGDKETSTTLSMKLYFDVQVKLDNLGDGFVTPPLGSHEFDIISSRINDNFGAILRSVPGYYAITLNELQSKNENGVFANMNVVVDSSPIHGKTLNARETLAQIEETLQKKLITGKVGSLAVDPQHLVIVSLHSNEMTDDMENEDGDVGSNIVQLGAAKLYVIIGCSVALTALALLQFCCTLYKNNKKTMKQERLIVNNGWKDYCATAKTNLGFESFETEEKASPPPVPSLPRFRDSPDTAISRRGEMVNATEKYKLNHQQISTVPARATYSLPRAPGSRHQSPPPPLDYYTQDRRNNRNRGHNNSDSQVSTQQPDFYFMPSQRKYSGEIVRVYVDYGSQKSK